MAATERSFFLLFSHWFAFLFLILCVCVCFIFSHSFPHSSTSRFCNLSLSDLVFLLFLNWKVSYELQWKNRINDAIRKKSYICVYVCATSNAIRSFIAIDRVLSSFAIDVSPTFFFSFFISFTSTLLCHILIQYLLYTGICFTQKRFSHRQMNDALETHTHTTHSVSHFLHFRCSELLYDEKVNIDTCTYTYMRELIRFYWIEWDKYRLKLCNTLCTCYTWAKGENVGEILHKKKNNWKWRKWNKFSFLFLSCTI